MNKKLIYVIVFLILVLFLISACKEYNGIQITENKNINQPPRCIDCAAPNPGCRYVLQPGEDSCETCGKLVCEGGEDILRSASILNLPIPKNSECFYHKNQNLPECSQYYKEGTTVCPKFYNPVYDSGGIFYPSACWAEHFGITNYNYGYSSQLKQFIGDLWFTKKSYQNKYFKVPEPDIEFTYQGSGLVGWRSGIFLRSVLWKNNSNFYILDYNIDTEDGTQQSTSFT